jgi:beta-fructofuranosidase
VLLFHLCAPEGLTKPQRDRQAEIWLARSHDLHAWESLGPAITAGPAGDLACWTGSTHHFGGCWYTYYTGRAARDGNAQHILLSVSDDPTRWRPARARLLSAPREHPTYLAQHPRVFPAWRDPFVVELDGTYLMLFAAQARHDGSPGCIGAARASRPEGPFTLVDPLIGPGLYDQLEVPQLLEQDGRWYLFFSCAARDYDPRWAAEVGAQTGLHCWVADAPLGPYTPLAGSGHVTGLGTDSGLYTTRLMPWGEGFVAIGWYWSPECFDANDSPHSPLTGVRALTLSAPRPQRVGS